jgi:hypothetical protein
MNKKRALQEQEREEKNLHKSIHTDILNPLSIYTSLSNKFPQLYDIVAL